MRHILKEKNQKFQVFSQKKSLLRFLSLRYSANFRRSRLVEVWPFSGTQVLIVLPAQIQFKLELKSHFCGNLVLIVIHKQNIRSMNFNENKKKEKL